MNEQDSESHQTIQNGILSANQTSSEDRIEPRSDTNLQDPKIMARKRHNSFGANEARSMPTKDEGKSRSAFASPESSQTNLSSELLFSSHGSSLSNSRPHMSRHGSLAEMVRFKKSYSKPKLVDNDIHKFYSVDSDNLQDASDIYSPQAYSSIPVEYRDNRAFQYMVPRSFQVEGGSENVAENPNFLYRIGSRVFSSTVRDNPERAGPSSREYQLSGGEEEEEDMFHVGKNFKFRDIDFSSCSESETEGDAAESRLGRFWSFVMTDILGFDTTRPKSIKDKKAARERSSGIFDPALVVALLAAFT